MPVAEAAALRAMQATDIAAVALLEATLQSHPWSVAQFRSSLDAGHHCLVLVQAQRLVGFAVVMPAADDAELLNIGVHADCQGAGMGRRLLAAAAALAHRGGARRLLLEVRASNVAARHLYDAAGFQVYHVRKGYYPMGDGREDALLMECSL